MEIGDLDSRIVCSNKWYLRFGRNPSRFNIESDLGSCNMEWNGKKHHSQCLEGIQYLASRLECKHPKSSWKCRIANIRKSFKIEDFHSMLESIEDGRPIGKLHIAYYLDMVDENITRAEISTIEIVHLVQSIDLLRPSLAPLN